MLEAFHFEFMRNALYAGLLTSIACGVIGTLVVVNRIVFISGGIAHASYGGIGLALYAGFSPMLGTAGFCLGIAAIMAMVTVRNRERSDAVIGVLWAVGMALGIIMVDLTPGYHADLMSFLFGSILTVPRSDLIIMVSLDVVILAVIIFFYKDFLAISFDEEFAAAMGVPVTGLYLTLLAMVALAVVMIIRDVGLILVIALLSIPPYIAEKYTDKLSATMLVSVLLNVLFTLVGLWLSYVFNLTSGATIIMVAAIFFFASVAYERVRLRFGAAL